MVARTATAQDDVTGDGTTSTVLLCGELLKQAERFASEGLHPRVITDGFEKAREASVEFLDKFKIAKVNPESDRELLDSIAQPVKARVNMLKLVPKAAHHLVPPALLLRQRVLPFRDEVGHLEGQLLLRHGLFPRVP